jgi:hypothetical protein
VDLRLAVGAQHFVFAGSLFNKTCYAQVGAGVFLALGTMFCYGNETVKIHRYKVYGFRGIWAQALQGLGL